MAARTEGRTSYRVTHGLWMSSAITWGLGVNEPRLAGWWAIAGVLTTMVMLDAIHRRSTRSRANTALGAITVTAALAMALLAIQWLVHMSAWSEVTPRQWYWTLGACAMAGIGLLSLYLSQVRHHQG